MHRSRRSRTPLLAARKLLAPPLILLSLSLSLLVAVAANAEATVKYIHEGQQAYERQLASGQIRAATFNKRVRSLHLTLKDGEHYLYRYPPKEQPKYAAQLKARRVPVSVLAPAAAVKEAAKAPVHHKIRYIAGGVLLAIIIVVGAVMLVNRRRRLAME